LAQVNGQTIRSFLAWGYAFQLALNIVSLDLCFSARLIIVTRRKRHFNDHGEVPRNIYALIGALVASRRISDVVWFPDLAADIQRFACIKELLGLTDELSHGRRLEERECRQGNRKSAASFQFLTTKAWTPSVASSVHR